MWFRFISFAVATLYGLGIPSTVDAATFTAKTVLGGAGCSETASGSITQVAFCPNVVGSPLFGAYAEAGPGALKTSAYATLQRDSVTGALLVNSSTVNASAIIADSLSFGVDSGTFEISVDLLGKLDVTGSLTSGGAGATGLMSYSLSSGAQNFGFSTFGDIFASPGTVSNVTSYVFSFTGGEMSLNGAMNASAYCGISNDCVVEASFENSLRFVGGIVRDTDGNIVEAGFLGSSSGFDYATGIEPHDRGISAVPLPAGLPLLTAALAFPVLLRRRPPLSDLTTHS